jgi:glycosyltransferase involved in cell wall biosynthesis
MKKNECIKISLVIPVYNEIKFIERTLLFALNEADEIIIGDNASTDGTSEICQEYANRYSKIKYTRHNANLGAIKNILFCINNAKGEYLRFIGAHDLVSRGSSKSMCKLLDNNPNAVLAYSKETVHLNSDYLFLSSCPTIDFEKSLISEKPYVRFSSLVRNLNSGSIIMSMYRTEILKNLVSKNFVMKDAIFSDLGVLAGLASMGKFVVDPLSTLYRINPREEKEDNYITTFKRINVDANKNPFETFFGIIVEVYAMAKRLQIIPSTPKNFDKKILRNLILRFAYSPGVDISLDNIKIIDGKEDVANEVFHKILQMRKFLILKNMYRNNSKFHRFLKKIFLR